MNVLKRVLGVSFVGVALAASVPATAKIALNKLASNKIALNKLAANKIALNRLAANKIALNKLAGNKLSTNTIAANAGDGAFTEITTIDLPNGSRVSY